MPYVSECPNGAATFSPGLPRFAATLGKRTIDSFNRNAVARLCGFSKAMTQPRCG